MKLPNDASDIEREIFDLLIKGVYEPKSTSNIYSVIEDPMDKFIAAFVFELGNTQKEAQHACGLSKKTIWTRIKRIKKQILPYACGNCLLNLRQEDDINY